MRLLLLLFVIIPLFELFLLIQIGSHIGALTTIVWLVLAGILGVAILRLQGALTLIQARESMARGEPPAEALGNGMLLALAGVLLIIPGFVSDLAAFLLLIPPFRRLLLRRWAARAEKRSYYYSGRVYEGEVESEPPRTSGSQLLEGELVEPERDNDKDKDNSQTR